LPTARRAARASFGRMTKKEPVPIHIGTGSLHSTPDPAKNLKRQCV
jgi:hypothetical protein